MRDQIKAFGWLHDMRDQIKAFGWLHDMRDQIKAFGWLHDMRDQIKAFGWLHDMRDQIKAGLIKELDVHKNEYATNFLASHSTYILVQKDLQPDDMSADSCSTPTPPQYTYKPLLEGSTDLFPNFRLHVAEVEKKKTKRGGSKSPSPAGRLLSKPKKNVSKPSTSKRKP
nr:hypothetical protein BaRGS_029060 [Batillaria attramentaria]